MRTVSIRLSDLDRAKIPIGFVGENEHTQVRIDCKKLFEEYPDATAAMTVLPPQGDSYPAVVIRDDDFVVWTVTDSDVIYEGCGEFQLKFSESGVIAKSYIGKTITGRSLTATGEIPDPVQNWIDAAEEVLEAVEEAIPTGGTTGQVLAKNSDTDYDLEWTDLSNVIDDTAGDGDTDVTWSADKITEELADKYEKPSGGIPSTDLASAVQTSLGKADTAYQKPGTGIPSSDMASAVQTSLGKADTAYQKPADGIPASDIANGVIPSVSTIIDDTAGSGTTNKTWSANKILSNRAPKDNPVFTGSISMHTKTGATTGTHSVTLGFANEASGAYSLAEGNATTASGAASHAEGYHTEASNSNAHAEGSDTTASGYFSHAEGYYTEATHRSHHVFGEYNVADDSEYPGFARGNYIEIVGNGTSLNAKSNARTLDWSGNEILAGDLTVLKGTANETSISSLKTAVSGKYEKPGTGIPATDLASAVQTSLGKADTAYQKPGTGIPDTDLASGVLTSIIDDTAGAGDTNKVWSADKSSDLLSQINGKVDKSALDDAGIISKTNVTLFNGDFSVTTATSADWDNPYARASVTGIFDDRYLHKVNFNGTDYVLPVRKWYHLNSLGTSIILYQYIGNIGLVVDDTSGIPEGVENAPFVILSDYDASTSDHIDILTSDAGTYTFNIKKITVNQKELPKSLIYGDSFELIKIISSSDGKHSLSIGVNDINNNNNYAIGNGNKLSGSNNYVFGTMNNVSGQIGFAVGRDNTVSGNCGVSFGNETVVSGASAFAEGETTTASGRAAHAEGQTTTASGFCAHAEGQNTTASLDGAHSEGLNTVAAAAYSHAEGNGSQTSSLAIAAHAEGKSTTASANYAHSEGRETTASGGASHAEGRGTTSSGGASHAEGHFTTASGYASHTEGNCTIANHRSQHVFGEYNVADPSSAGVTDLGNYIEIIGNGTEENARSNARTLDTNGNERIKGDLYVGCNADSTGGTKIEPTVTETVTGSTPSITGVANHRYICGEVSTLTITVPASGCIDVMFTSGSTATLLTVTPTKTGVTTVKWANGFNPTSLDANTTYELNIIDGEYGVGCSWI